MCVFVRHAPTKISLLDARVSLALGVPKTLFGTRRSTRRSTPLQVTKYKPSKPYFTVRARGTVYQVTRSAGLTYDKGHRARGQNTNAACHCGVPLCSRFSHCLPAARLLHSRAPRRQPQPAGTIRVCVGVVTHDIHIAANGSEDRSESSKKKLKSKRARTLGLTCGYSGCSLQTRGSMKRPAVRWTLIVLGALFTGRAAAGRVLGVY